MITWDIEKITTSLVEELLPTSSPPDKGFLIRWEFSLRVHSENDVFYSNRVLELVFQRPSNYTKVFSRVLDLHGNVIQDWEFRSDHDSCWRSDGLVDVFECYMAVREDMENQYPEFNHKETEVSIKPPTFGGFTKFVEVEIERGDSPYQSKLKSVK